MNIPQKHTNGSTWVFSYAGADGHGKRHWQWSCINADESVDVYPCSENGWIDSVNLPKVVGTHLVVYTSTWEAQECSIWYEDNNGDCHFHASGAVTHWRPQMGNPV